MSGLLSAGIMAFTLTVMEPVNSALHARVKDVMRSEDEATGDRSATDNEETEGLIRNWGKVNAQRSLLPILAAVAATFAATL